MILPLNIINYLPVRLSWSNKTIPHLTLKHIKFKQLPSFFTFIINLLNLYNMKRTKFVTTICDIEKNRITLTCPLKIPYAF